MTTTLSRSPGWRYAAFGSLNLSQGLIIGFIATSYFYLLTDLDLSAEQVGFAMAIARLPWAFKLIWGPLFDRYEVGAWGRRRPFILIGQFLLGLCVLGMAFVPQSVEHLGTLAVMTFLASMAATIQNIAVNGLCVDIVAQGELGRSNAVIWASKSLGVAIGGGGFYALTAHAPWSVLLVVMALVIWALTIIPLVIAERGPGEQLPANGRRLDMGELRRTFRVPMVWLAMAIALSIPLGYGLMATPFSYLLRSDLGWSQGQIGLLTGVVDAVVGIAGSLTGGFLTDRFGARRIMTIAALGMAASMAALGSFPELWQIPACVFGWYIFHFAVQYLFGASLLAFFMALSNPAIGATHIGIYFALNNLCYSFCDWGGGWLKDHYGYSSTFLLCAAIQLVTLLPLVWCDPRSLRRAFLPAGPAPARPDVAVPPAEPAPQEVR
jgi:PAT family beta-lactamase induction signal transducer AmpG